MLCWFNLRATHCHIVCTLSFGTFLLWNINYSCFNLWKENIYHTKTRPTQIGVYHMAQWRMQWHRLCCNTLRQTLSNSGEYSWGREKQQPPHSWFKLIPNTKMTITTVKHHVMKRHSTQTHYEHKEKVTIVFWNINLRLHTVFLVSPQ